MALGHFVIQNLTFNIHDSVFFRSTNAYHIFEMVGDYFGV